MLNRVVLQGNIGRDPRVSLTQEGKEIVNFSLATTQHWKDKTGEWQSTTDWHNVSIFRESTVGWAKDVLKRGDSVYVEGKLSYNHWIDRDGKKRVTAHVCVAARDGKVQQLSRPDPIPLSSNNNPSLPSNSNLNHHSGSDLNLQNKVQLQLKSASVLSEGKCISESLPESREESQDIPLETLSAEIPRVALVPPASPTISSEHVEEMEFQQKNQLIPD